MQRLHLQTAEFCHHTLVILINLLLSIMLVLSASTVGDAWIRPDQAGDFVVADFCDAHAAEYEVKKPDLRKM